MSKKNKMTDHPPVSVHDGKAEPDTWFWRFRPSVVRDGDYEWCECEVCKGQGVLYWRDAEAGELLHDCCPTCRGQRGQYERNMTKELAKDKIRQEWENQLRYEQEEGEKE